jgi:hypothetical protein
MKIRSSVVHPDTNVGGLFTLLDNERKEANFQACIEWELANYLQGRPHQNTSAFLEALKRIEATNG